MAQIAVRSVSMPPKASKPVGKKPVRINYYLPPELVIRVDRYAEKLAAEDKLGRVVTRTDAIRILLDEALKTTSGGACPTFFRAACAEAARGGTNGYEEAGYLLASHLGSLAPFDVEDEEWADRLEELNAPGEANDAAMIEWFSKHLPRCLALVPAKRHEAFIKGVLGYLEEHGLG